jgi:hypothetical protein
MALDAAPRVTALQTRPWDHMPRAGAGSIPGER